MLTPTLLVVAVFATWRMARFLALDTLLKSQRSWLVDVWPWRREPDDGRPLSDRRFVLVPWRDKVAELVSCGYCNSFWLAGLVLVALFTGLGGDSTLWPTTNPLLFGVQWWAVAGGAAFLNRLDVGGEKQKKIAEAIDHVADSTGQVGGFDDNEGETDG